LAGFLIMPKYKPETEKIKAKNLIKPYISNRLNQSALARQEGVTPSAINQRVNRKPVQDALQAYINSPKLKNKLIRISNAALDAKHYTKKGSKPDYDVRHKYWHDLLTAAGVLKINGNGKGAPTAIIIRIGNTEVFSPAQATRLSELTGQV